MTYYEGNKNKKFKLYNREIEVINYKLKKGTHLDSTAKHFDYNQWGNYWVLYVLVVNSLPQFGLILASIVAQHTDLVYQANDSFVSDVIMFIISY